MPHLTSFSNATAFNQSKQLQEHRTEVADETQLYSHVKHPQEETLHNAAVVQTQTFSCFFLKVDLVGGKQKEKEGAMARDVEG